MGKLRWWQRLHAYFTRVPQTCGCGGSDGSLADYLICSVPSLKWDQAQEVVRAIRLRTEEAVNGL